MNINNPRFIGRIPKICHLYWDNTPMSFLQTITIESFHKYNPDWKIIIYTPDTEYNGGKLSYLSHLPDYTGEDNFHLVKNLEYVTIKTMSLKEYDIDPKLHNILRSDIFRYKILYEQGGIWSDFDVVWLQPINKIYNVDYVGNIDFNEAEGAVCMYNTTTGHHNISVLISAPRSEYMLSLINQTTKLQSTSPERLQHQTFGTQMLNDMYPTYNDVKKIYNNVIGLKYETIFPYSINNMELLYDKTDLTVLNKNVLCVHWFFGHFLSKKYVNQDGYRTECSMTRILKKENWI